MPWVCKENKALKIVELVFTDTITGQDLRESTSECIRMEEEEGLNRFLVDTTKMVLSSSLMEVYDLPTRQYIEESADRLGRVAILPPKCEKTHEAVRFYETVCRNRGWLVEVFADVEKAREWLYSTEI